MKISTPLFISKQIMIVGGFIPYFCYIFRNTMDIDAIMYVVIGFVFMLPVVKCWDVRYRGLLDQRISEHNRKNPKSIPFGDPLREYFQCSKYLMYLMEISCQGAFTFMLIYSRTSNTARFCAFLLILITTVDISISRDDPKDWDVALEQDVSKVVPVAQTPREIAQPKFIPVVPELERIAILKKISCGATAVMYLGLLLQLTEAREANPSAIAIVAASFSAFVKFIEEIARGCYMSGPAPETRPPPELTAKWARLFNCPKALLNLVGRSLQIALASILATSPKTILAQVVVCFTFTVNLVDRLVPRNDPKPEDLILPL